ncbi:MAG: LytTR family DNA-binding domain-containing protein [Pseudomonadota bacterium]
MAGRWENLKAAAVLDERERVQAGVLLGATALLVYLGPFGTGAHLGLVERTIYWGVSLFAGWCGGSLFNWKIRPAVASQLPTPALRAGTAGAATLSAFVCVAVLEALLRQPLPLRILTDVFLSVLAISVAVTGVMTLSLKRFEEAADADPKLAAFRARLPADQRAADILTLSAEDHYVRVRTTAGEALIAATFADAVEAVRLLDGARVHRGWWASTDAVARIDRTGGRWTLLTTDGREAPVSRSYRNAVRDKGWDRLG